MLKRIAIMATLLAAMCSYAHGQTPEDSYKFDIGVGLGMSGYLGDANQSNMYKHPGFAANGWFRYMFDSRWAIRTMLSTASLSGNTSEFENALPFGEQYEFKSQVYDLGVRGEFNFFNYGIGETYKHMKRWTPFLGIGVGMTMSSCDGKTHAGVNVPMSFGVKFKIRPRLNLEACFTMTKTFSDHVDGQYLDDLYQIKSSFIKNTDWYSMLTVGISYEFGKRCVVCHRID